MTEPHYLSDGEAVRFHHEVLRVGAAMEQLYQPLKINYMTLGNGMPHTRITARYHDDPAPGGPLPAGPMSEVPTDQLIQDAEALGRLLR